MPRKNSNTVVIGQEYCAGYVDKYGMWNNGFYCPKWGGATVKYCCGTERHRYCCPQPEVKDRRSQDMSEHIPLVVGLTIGAVIAVAIITLILCICCKCCILYKRRKRPAQNDEESPGRYYNRPSSTSPTRLNGSVVRYTVCSHHRNAPSHLHYCYRDRRLPAPPPSYPHDDPPPYPGEGPTPTQIKEAPENYPFPEVSLSDTPSRRDSYEGIPRHILIRNSYTDTMPSTSRGESSRSRSEPPTGENGRVIISMTNGGDDDNIDDEQPSTSGLTLPSSRGGS